MTYFLMLQVKTAEIHMVIMDNFVARMIKMYIIINKKFVILFLHIVITI